MQKLIIFRRKVSQVEMKFEGRLLVKQKSTLKGDLHFLYSGSQLVNFVKPTRNLCGELFTIYLNAAYYIKV